MLSTLLPYSFIDVRTFTGFAKLHCLLHKGLLAFDQVLRHALRDRSLRLPRPVSLAHTQGPPLLQHFPQTCPAQPRPARRTSGLGHTARARARRVCCARSAPRRERRHRGMASLIERTGCVTPRVPMQANGCCVGRKTTLRQWASSVRERARES